MKRAIVFLLAAAMIVSLLGVSMVSATADDEVIMYWDFENTTLADMASSTSNAFGYAGTTAIVAGGANGSASAFMASNVDSGNHQWIFGLQPSTTYTVYFWAKEANKAADTWPLLGVSNYDENGSYVTYGTFTSDWAQYSLDFTTGASTTSAMVYTWIYGNAVDFYVDDVIVIKKPTSQCQFWNAEANNLALLNTMPGYYSTNASIVAGGAKRSDYCIKVTGLDSGNGSWVTNLTPSTTYVLTFWAKKVGDSSATAAFGVQNYGGANIYYTEWTSSWAKYSIEFTTGSSNTSAQIWSWTWGSGDVEFYIDEVSVAAKQATPAPANPMADWDFETGTLAPLGTADGNDSDGYYAVGNLSVVSGGANGTDYALSIPASDCGNGQILTGLSPLTTYTVSFWAKVPTCDAGVYPNFGVSEYDSNGSYVAESAFTSEWAQYSMDFTTGPSATSAKVYTWVFGSGSCDFLVDEVCFARKGAALEAWNCEHNNIALLGTANGGDADGYYASGSVSITDGGANGSDYALLISGESCGNGQTLTMLDASTAYQITFWAKVENRANDAWPNVGVNNYDGNAYQSVTVTSGEWAQYTLNFTTGLNSTQATFYTWIYGPGTADLLLDDVSIQSLGHVHNFSGGYCTICGAEEQVLKIKSASLHLDEDIDVIYTVLVPDGYTNPYMVINGTTITTSEAAGDYRQFVYTGLTPQRMTDNISATLYATKDGVTENVSVANYSIKQYCSNMLTANPDNAALKTLLSDLLTYGAAAQNYTNYNTNNLATDDLTLTPSTFTAISGKAVSFTGTADSGTYWSEATLVLGNTVGIRLYFYTDAQINIDVTIGNSTESFDSGFVSCGNGRYYLDIPGIDATDFDTTVSATFYDNGEPVGNTINYTVNAYICGTQNTENTTLRALVRALYNYGASAAAYAAE